MPSAFMSINSSVALEVKSEVLGLSPEHVNYRADLG